MVVYRVANTKFKDNTLSGIGSEKVGGRWNEPGTRAVYCSENIALALLEYYVHSGNSGHLPKEIDIAKIEFPDSFPIETIKSLPKNWNQYPYTSNTTSIFTNLAKNRNRFALHVPSSIVPLETNIILNPLYEDFGKVRVSEFIGLPVDERMRKT